MALLIDINTDELENAVQIARRTNAQLTEVANLLNSIVIHNDWQCRSRDLINSNTSRNRQDSMMLQSDAEAFYNNISYASQEFQAAEQMINSSFDAVDSPLADFLSRTPMMVNNPPTNIGAAQDLLKDAGGGVRKAMNVVSFDNIADAFKGK